MDEKQKDNVRIALAEAKKMDINGEMIPIKPAGKSPQFKKKSFSRPTKKQAIIGGIIMLALVGGLTAAYSFMHKTPAKPVASTTPTPAPPPPPITSPLTGEVVSADDAKRIVTGAMIENSDFARPQSGLREAGVVFEGIAEAGITRFLALYQESQPKNMGPIRSARPYFLQWDLGFDAPLAHVGGSPEALADIKRWHVKDLDQFYNSQYYHRISSRPAPHNVYTSIANLNAAEKAKGWKTSTFTGFPRKTDTPSTTPNATNINFAISSQDFYVHYAYDPKANAYKRSEGGAPHTDATTGRQLAPHVVVAMVVPYKLEADGYHSDYMTTGIGRVYVFEDGLVHVGMWKKTAANNQIQFLNADNKPILLNAGQTWITAVAAAGEVTYGK
jgi:hypothetical protein